MLFPVISCSWEKNFSKISENVNEKFYDKLSIEILRAEWIDWKFLINLIVAMKISEWNCIKYEKIIWELSCHCNYSHHYFFEKLFDLIAFYLILYNKVCNNIFF